MRSVGFRLALGTVLTAVAFTGCGGGGSSSTPGDGLAEAQLQTTGQSRKGGPHHQQEVRKREQRERREHEEFLVEEESRINKEEREKAEEARAQKAEHEAHKAQQEAKSKVPPGVSPITAEEFWQFKSDKIDFDNWEIAYSICQLTPERQLANEFHTEENPAAIAHAYGSEYKEIRNIAPEEGCLAGMSDSKKQWEAALNELPFNEL